MALVLRTKVASGVPTGNGQGKQALVRQNSLEGGVSTAAIAGV